MSKCYINFVLHNHMPFVRETEKVGVSEEIWFFSNLTESQIPLLKMLHRLDKDNISCCLTLSFSGVMITMLKDPLLKDHYRQYLKNLINLGKEEILRTENSDSEEENKLAIFYCQFYQETLEFFDSINQDILNQYKYFSNKGLLHIIASSVSHAYFPNYQSYPYCVDLQIRLGKKIFEEAFEGIFQGFWLPECGYYPKLEFLLKKRNVSYFFLNTNSIFSDEKRTSYGPYAPIAVNGINAFIRDPYFHNFFDSPYSYSNISDVYRDYYKDIGLDHSLVDTKLLFPSQEGLGMYTGYKYYSQNKEKTFYNPEKAFEQARSDAHHFINKVNQYTDKISPLIQGRKPIFNIFNDADLFGKWWFEGFVFLEEFLREVSSNSEMETITGEKYLEIYPKSPIQSPVFSSWSKGGYSEPWLNDTNDWVCRLTHAMIDRWQDLLSRHKNTNSFQQKKMIVQALRELLLAQASDWPCMIWQGDRSVYAAERVREHYDNFEKIQSYLINHKYDVASFIQMEKKNNILDNLLFEDLYSDVFDSN